jgi:hypothetical protein
MPPTKRLESLRAAGSAMTNRSIVLVFFLSLLACSTVGTGSGAGQNEPTAVRVDNQGFTDMTVYAVRSSQRVRLGLVPGHAVKTFDVPPGLVSGLTTLRFVADPIGSTRPSVSEEITVAPGDTVMMMIPPI